MKVKLHWITSHNMQLAMMARPRGGEWLVDEIDSLAKQGIQTVVSLLTDAEIVELDLGDEAIACIHRGIEYARCPIEDRSVPKSAAAFRMLLEELFPAASSGRRIAIHCRMGIGRSSLLAALLLNRGGCPIEEAFGRIRAARGCNVPDTTAQLAWAMTFATT